MDIRFKYAVLLIIAITGFPCSFSQSPKSSSGISSITITPHNGEYLYHSGDTVDLDIILTYTRKGGNPPEVIYKLSEVGGVLLKQGRIALNSGRGTVRGVLGHPGFLRCDVTCPFGEDTLHAACGCGFSVGEIKPAGKLPGNFSRFWREAKAELLRVPVDAYSEEVAVVDSGDAKRYKITLAGVDGTHVYGWLHLPAGEGPFPVVLSIPGSGVGRTGRYAGFTKAGIAVFAIEIHGLKPGKREIVGAVQWIKPADEEINYYIKLQNGILYDYHSFGIEDPYRYYHRRTIQAAFRAIDYLYSRKDIDTGRVVVFGGSQGGGLSLLTTALDERINAVVATVPAFCNNTARYVRMSDKYSQKHLNRIITTLSFYDAALAAEFIKVPALIGVGFLDKTCLPSDVYSAYNNLEGAKTIENFYLLGHGSPEYWREKTILWIKRTLDIR